MCSHVKDIERFEALGQLVLDLSKRIDAEPIETIEDFKDRLDTLMGLGDAFAKDYREYLDRVHINPNVACGVVYGLVQQIDLIIVSAGFRLNLAAQQLKDQQPLLNALGIKPKKKEHYIN